MSPGRKRGGRFGLLLVRDLVNDRQDHRPPDCYVCGYLSGHVRPGEGKAIPLASRRGSLYRPRARIHSSMGCLEEPGIHGKPDVFTG